MDKNTVSPFFVPSGIFICGSAWYDFFAALQPEVKVNPVLQRTKNMMNKQNNMTFSKLTNNS